MKNLFKNLGLTEKETNAFLKMLELGAQPISVVAKYVGVPRSSMYAILERLKKLQLIEEFNRGKITFVKCIPANNIEELLLAKETKIQQTLQIFEKSLPQLEAMENKFSITPRVKFLEGKDAVMKMYEEVLKEKEFYAIFNPELVAKIMPEYFYKVGEELKKNKGKALEMLVDCAEAQDYKTRFNSALHQVKILPEKAEIPSDTIICNDKIYMIAYGEKQISATEIINTSLSRAMRTTFELLWERLR